jgi:hypothetical protein
MKLLATAVLLALVLLTVACSHRDNVSYQDSVEKALQQSELQDVTVSEDQDKNTITLGGTLHSDETKSKAAEIAKAATDTHHGERDQRAACRVGVSSEGRLFELGRWDRKEL